MDRNGVREQLGAIGVWLGRVGPLPPEDERAVITEVERLGYRTLWITETVKEAFAHAGIALAASERLVVATGIASIWARRPATMASGAQALGGAFPGRFVLGLGVSHPRFEPSYRNPYSAMRDYLDGMDEAGYGAPAPVPPVPRLIGALRPKMLELAATRLDGAHPYCVPVEHTAFAREVMGGDALLAPEVAVVLDADPVTARAAARKYLALYLALPNYTNNLRAFGFGDDDLADGGSDRLVDAIVAWGDADAISRRVREHLDAGANHVCIQPVPADGTVGLDTLAELAPALLSRVGM